MLYIYICLTKQIDELLTGGLVGECFAKLNEIFCLSVSLFSCITELNDSQNDNQLVTLP